MLNEGTMDKQLNWPERPTCHDGDWQARRFGQQTWREPRGEHRDPKYGPDPYRETYRTCSYCGSMHPEDLFTALQAGARLGITDKLYKFYVEGIPNPKAGEDLPCYSFCSKPSPKTLAEGGWEEIADGYDERTGAPKTAWRKLHSTGKCPPTLPAKWYNDHLLDLEPATFQAITDLIAQRTGRRYFVGDRGQLMVRGEASPAEA
jgi:hypothetical protein